MNTITTGSIVTVSKVLPLGTVTTYVADAVSIYVTYKGVTTRYNAALVNASLIASGSISASIPFPTDGMYQIKVVSESAVDLDTNGTVSTQIASTSVIAYTSSTSIVMQG